MSEKKKAFGVGKSLFSAGGIVLMLLILVFINAIASQANLRWDATADNLYSLSDGTLKILSDLDRKVDLKVFFSRDNVNTPVHIKNYAERVIDFLQEYERHGGGKVRVTTHNPEPDTEAEDWAQKYGLQPAGLPTGERLYFGLVAVSADQEETIPSMDPTREANLEYDITRIISRLQSARKPKLGILTGLPVFGGSPNMAMMQMGQQPQPAWVFLQELQKSYEVSEIDAGGPPGAPGGPPEDISIDPSDYDLVMLMHAKDLSEAARYAVDQYLLAGGNLIVMADPLAVSDSPSAPGQPQGSSIPDDLLKAWGLSIDGAKVVADYDYATRVRNAQNQVENSPVWLSVPSGGVNPDNITTADLESLLLPAAGAIEKLESAPYEYETLIHSSANSALVDSFRVRFGTESLRREFTPTVESYDLAVRVRGKFKTAFPNGKPGAADDAGAGAAGAAGAGEDGAGEDGAGEDGENPDGAAGKGLTEGAATATVVVIADADFLYDAFYVDQRDLFGFKIARIFNDNLNFLLNTCELLTGSEALIGIRSRGTFERPFERVEELEKKAQARWLSREQELVRKVEETNSKLQQLEGQKDPSQEFILSEKQEAEIRKFQEEKQRINQELKIVRRNLRSDIEALGARVKFVNIFGMPILISLAGLGYALYRRRKSENRG